MSFTPIESSIGGLLIGFTVIFHMLFTGRVSGISGNLSLAIKPGLVPWKNWARGFLYILGLLAAGFLIYFIPPLHDVSYGPVNTTQFPMYVFAIAGLLVGFGTALGSGCTSGHMICGVARLSKRSFVATITFCATAFLIVKAARTVDYVAPPKPANQPFVTVPPLTPMLVMIGILVLILVIYLVLWAALAIVTTKCTRAVNDRVIAVLVSMLSLFNGFVFGIGLAFSGMVRGEKVLGFFDIFGPHWDPSLVCVAGGAIATSLVLFNVYVLRIRKRPVVEKVFDLSNSSEITWQLVVGAILFGVGWGLIGFCPGPVIVNLPGSYQNSNFITFFIALIAGAYIEYFRTQICFSKKQEAQAKPSLASQVQPPAAVEPNYLQVVPPPPANHKMPMEGSSNQLLAGVPRFHPNLHIVTDGSRYYFASGDNSFSTTTFSSTHGVDPLPQPNQSDTILSPTSSSGVQVGTYVEGVVKN